MAVSTTIRTAKRHYSRHSPLHGASRQHKADLEVIAKASSPMLKADTLIAQRRDQKIDQRIDQMLSDLQGKRTRYRYDQSAVTQIEHLLDQPMDPQTQLPIWRDMLAATKGTTMPKADFMRGARAILSQFSLYDPQTMAS